MTNQQQSLKYSATTFFFLSHLRALTYSLGKLTKKCWMNGLTILVLAIVLAIPTMFISFINGVKASIPSWQQSATINLYLKPNISKLQLSQLVNQLKQNNQIKTVTTISAKQGLNDLTTQLQLPDILNQLPNNPLPTVIQLTPSAQVNSIQMYQTLTKQLQQNSLVDQAQNSFTFTQRLLQMMHLLNHLAWIIGIIFAVAVIIIIATIMRLALAQEADEIQVMHFIGASRRMILRPLLYQGVWLGFIAGFVSMLLVMILGAIISHPIQQLLSLYQISWHASVFFHMSTLLITWLIACLLTWLGTYISLLKA